MRRKRYSKRIPPEEEVLGFFDERIGHYQGLKDMYLNDMLLVYRAKDGSLIYTKRDPND